MAARYYILCGENGLLIKSNVSFYKAQALLNRYCRGLRYVRKAETLREAQALCLDFAAQQERPVKLPCDILVNQMILFRKYPKGEDPMVFTEISCEEEFIHE